MKKSVLKPIKTITPILLGLFLIYYSFSKTSTQDRELIYDYISNADLFWVFLSMIIGVLSHLSRAIRWNYLLKPLGHQPPLFSNILITLMSYFTNLGIPRSGEILRATALSTYEDVPFQKGFGTIVTERIIDLIVLFIVIAITLSLQTQILLQFFEDQNIPYFWMVIALIIVIAAGYLVLRFFKKSPSVIAQKGRNFFGGLIEGASSILKLEKKWLFIAHSLFIWIAYFAMFWVIKFTVPETVDLSMSQLLVAFVAGAFAMTATNGGIGLYPIAVNKSLAIFGISAVAGNAFGWIVWISQTAMVVVLGALSFVIIPFVASKNK